MNGLSRLEDAFFFPTEAFRLDPKLASTQFEMSLLLATSGKNLCRFIPEMLLLHSLGNTSGDKSVYNYAATRAHGTT